VFVAATCVGSASAQTLTGSRSIGPGPIEARFGAFSHGVGGDEQGSVDLNAEVVFSRLWTWSPTWNWLIPRPHLGAMVNTANKTSYVYAGGLWSYDITPKFFVEGFFGGAIHNGSLEGDATHSALGCRGQYHVGGSMGYHITQPLSVMFTFDHISNGNGVMLSNCDKNNGLNEYGLRLAWEFN